MGRLIIRPAIGSEPLIRCYRRELEYMFASEAFLLKYTVPNSYTPLRLPASRNTADQNRSLPADQMDRISRTRQHAVKLQTKIQCLYFPNILSYAGPLSMIPELQLKLASGSNCFNHKPLGVLKSGEAPSFIIFDFPSLQTFSRKGQVSFTIMAAEEPPWHAAFPTPTRAPPTYPKADLLRQFTILGDILNAGTLLIDVRRTDFEGGTIRGSLNLPAQSFPYQMSTLYRLCKGDGMNVISRVMFYCGKSIKCDASAKSSSSPDPFLQLDDNPSHL